MRFIGITGGVGAGKSELLHYIEREFPAKILLADELAHELMRQGTDCYREIGEVFAGEDLYKEDGSFDSAKLAGVIFSDPAKREKMNAIVHPAVKREVLRLVESERRKGRCEYFILEAALLIEEGYDEICDELWYVDAGEEVRREILRKSRGYSEEKIEGIFRSQLSEGEYRKVCCRVIDNSGTLDEACEQVRRALAG